MTRRAKIRAFLLGLLIGGGSWTAAAHDDATAPKTPCDGVVADCPSESTDLPGDDEDVRLNADAVDSTETASLSSVAQPACWMPPPQPLALALGQLEMRAFIASVRATVGQQMSGTPSLGLLSGSS